MYNDEGAKIIYCIILFSKLQMLLPSKLKQPNQLDWPGCFNLRCLTFYKVG